MNMNVYNSGLQKEHDYIRLGMMVQELNMLYSKYGMWLQGAEVFTATQADPIALLSMGGGDYCVQLFDRSIEPKQNDS